MLNSLLSHAQSIVVKMPTSNWTRSELYYSTATTRPPGVRAGSTTQLIPQCRSCRPPVNLLRASGYPEDPRPAGPGLRLGRRTLSLTSHSTIKTPSERPDAQSNKPASNRGSVNFLLDQQGLLIEFGKGRSTKFDHIWLRDNCRCEKCFHPHTKQRLVETFEIPLDIQPTRVDMEVEGLSLTWPDGHKSFIEFSFLLQNSYEPPLGPSRQLTSSQIRKTKYLWDKTIISYMPQVSYNDIFSSDESTWKGDFYVLEWLRKIDKYGFCLVDDVPSNPEATEELLKRIAFIRETHYGAFWDFTANMEHGDTAYTNLPLGAHTDTTYFSDPAGLQLFHLLSPPTSHEGGKSLLVDGFAAAEKLRREQPAAYRVLSEVPIDTHASGGTDVAFKPVLPQPVFSHHPRTGELTIIRWNPDDRLPIRGRSGQEVKQLYLAIREWEKIIKSDQMELWTQMKMGQALIFDNHRVLHGRSSFTGSRRLCGGYVNRDDYRSRLRSLEQRLSSSCPKSMEEES
ncbi:hypothetical protein Pst134EA_004753 [Puccinia striiformis f. sp. tritici]|uniref:hypothetical protein n=1 Tax=Puccinia striiformis f. sp. tritici TaxID=168172 RepID=UPI0020080841|nr:hypothetical protein Pst134EA_004753 [Puccinia striiformis f. sp. tritici]KAH9461915.1 hypothetical protein Pst134EB_005830 [Puccinia striiformis f. sp. tritici]KAH9470835.1 hypothetical protein Pst134EA_004753 [Puccinia striiformis f. sp. tritici]KAI9613502.1 hypothetical protein H4Q26_010107 [Puccinia striiformis f. sp. tritici PST-130]